MEAPGVDLLNLDAPFSEEEIWASVRAMPNNKSPGPDGFTWEFFKRCWAIVKSDVIATLHAAFNGSD
jgi:hypothetical protein